MVNINKFNKVIKEQLSNLNASIHSAVLNTKPQVPLWIASCSLSSHLLHRFFHHHNKNYCLDTTCPSNRSSSSNNNTTDRNTLQTPSPLLSPLNLPHPQQC